MLARPSTHFRWSEFRCHDGTSAPGHSHPDLRQLCVRYLEPLRRRYGVVWIISGYRTPEHNERVGGAPSSYHVYRMERVGVAADIAASRGTPAQWFALLDALDAPGLGKYPGHVHVDNRDGHARW